VLLYGETAAAMHSIRRQCDRHSYYLPSASTIRPFISPLRMSSFHAEPESFGLHDLGGSGLQNVVNRRSGLQHEGSITTEPPARED